MSHLPSEKLLLTAEVQSMQGDAVHRGDQSKGYHAVAFLARKVSFNSLNLR